MGSIFPDSGPAPWACSHLRQLCRAIFLPPIVLLLITLTDLMSFTNLYYKRVSSALRSMGCRWVDGFNDCSFIDDRHSEVMLCLLSTDDMLSRHSQRGRFHIHL